MSNMSTECLRIYLILLRIFSIPISLNWQSNGQRNAFRISIESKQKKVVDETQIRKTMHSIIE